MLTRPKNKNMLTIKGKTVKRKDIIWLKEYFDSIHSKNKYSSGMSHSNLPSVSGKSDGDLNPDGSKKGRLLI